MDVSLLEEVLYWIYLLFIEFTININFQYELKTLVHSQTKFFYFSIICETKIFFAYHFYSRIHFRLIDEEIK